MAKRGRPRIHQPKIPEGERAKVTIGNQEKQIRLLIDRVEELRNQNDFLISQRERMEEAHQSEREIWNGAMQEFNDKSIAYTRLLGFQDCAREIIEQLIDK